MSTIKSRILHLLAERSGLSASEICAALQLAKKNTQVTLHLRALLREKVLIVADASGNQYGRRYSLAESLMQDGDPVAAAAQPAGTNPFEWQTYQRWEPEKTLA